MLHCEGLAVIILLKNYCNSGLRMLTTKAFNDQLYSYIFQEQYPFTKLVLQSSTAYVVIFAVDLFSRISRVSPRENDHFNISWLFIVIKTSHKSRNKVITNFSTYSKIAKIYVYTKYMAYTVQYFILLSSHKTYKSMQDKVKL